MGNTHCEKQSGEAILPFSRRLPRTLQALAMTGKSSVHYCYGQIWMLLYADILDFINDLLAFA